VRKDGKPNDVVNRTVTGYVEQFATYLMPVGIVGGSPTFSWSGINGATGYWVHVNGQDLNWGEWVDAPQTSLAYTGPALVSGRTYTYTVNSHIETDGQWNQSLVTQSFTYNPSVANTVAFMYKVTDIADNPISGATVAMTGNESLSTTTAENGSFTLSGLPSNAPWSVKVSKSGYLDTYSYDFSTNQNVIGRIKSFYLYTHDKFTEWGIVPGKSAIIGTTVYHTRNLPVEDAIVTYKSAMGNTYTVKYIDAGGNLVNTPSLSGVYIILNVATGDTVWVQAIKTGLNFSPLVFHTHADSASMGAIFGTAPVFSAHSAASGNVPEKFSIWAYFSDLENAIQSVTLSGAGLPAPMPLPYHSLNRVWGGVPFDCTLPHMPQIYTLTITPKTGSPTTQQYWVTDFIDPPVLQAPATGSTVSGNPVFSWTGISGHRYFVELSRSIDNKIIWSKYALTDTSVTYDGPPLVNDPQHPYVYVVKMYDPGTGNVSGAGTYFFYQAASPLYGSFTGTGIWQWGGSAWTQLTPDNPESIVAAGANLYGKFANGIWQWTGSGWTHLTPDRPASMVASGSNLYGNFTGNGIWQWNGSGWTQLTPDNPESMVAAGSNLYGKFGNGIWQWTGSGWTKLTSDRPAEMVAAGSNLYGSFTGSGIWQWNGSSWTQLTADIPEAMAAAGTNLYGKFGNGVWQWTGSGWNKLTPDKPASMAASGNNLYGTFTGNGVWQWNGSAWTQLTPDNPAMMAVGE
jgi:hypothetical protein